MLVKQTMQGHGADMQTKKEFYTVLANKLKQTGLPELESQGQQYSSMAQNF